jgi:O-antigen ligase
MQWRFDRVAVGAAVVGGPWVAWLISQESWREVALLCAAAVMPLAFRWPITLIFGAYVFVLPFSHVAVVADSGGVSMTRLIGIVAICAFVAVGLVEKRLVRPPASALWLIALVLWAITTLAWSVSPEESWGRLPTVVSLVALYLAAVCFRVSERELRIVCLLAMIGGALAATAGVISGFADAPDAARASLSVAGQTANPNGVAQILLLPVGMAVGLLLSSRNVLSRVAALAVIVAVGAAIFLTMSRGSLLAIAIMLCVLLVRSRVRWQVVVVVGVLAVLLPFMPDMFFERVNVVITGEEPTGAGRTEIWQVGMSLLSRFGWLGSGFNTFAIVHGGGRAPHNIFLGTWVDLGAVGLALLLTMFFTHLRIARRASSGASELGFPVAIEAVCYAILVSSCFGDSLWAKHFWVPWILAVWASRNARPVGVKSRSTVSEVIEGSPDRVNAFVGHVTTRY